MKRQADSVSTLLRCNLIMLLTVVFRVVTPCCLFLQVTTCKTTRRHNRFFTTLKTSNLKSTEFSEYEAKKTYAVEVILSYLITQPVIFISNTLVISLLITGLFSYRQSFRHSFNKDFTQIHNRYYYRRINVINQAASLLEK
jgi:hypothetical protein